MRHLIEPYQGGRIDDSITNVVLLDFDNQGHSKWKPYVDSLEKPLVIFTGHMPPNAKNKRKAGNVVFEWCRERDYPCRGFMTKIAKPDLTDYMLVVSATEILFNNPILKECKWVLLTRDKGLQSAATVLQYYVHQQSVNTVDMHGTTVTTF